MTGKALRELLKKGTVGYTWFGIGIFVNILLALLIRLDGGTGSFRSVCSLPLYTCILLIVPAVASIVKVRGYLKTKHANFVIIGLIILAVAALLNIITFLSLPNPKDSGSSSNLLSPTILGIITVIFTIVAVLAFVYNVIPGKYRKILLILFISIVVVFIVNQAIMYPKQKDIYKEISFLSESENTTVKEVYVNLSDPNWKPLDKNIEKNFEEKIEQRCRSLSRSLKVHAWIEFLILLPLPITFFISAAYFNKAKKREDYYTLDENDGEEEDEDDSYMDDSVEYEETDTTNEDKNVLEMLYDNNHKRLEPDYGDDDEIYNF